MAHNFESGFFARQGAWHGLGTVVEGEQTWEAALALAGLNWSVDKLATVIDNGAQEALLNLMKAVRGGSADALDKAMADALRVGPKVGALAHAIQRTDSRRVIGSVGDLYTPFQNRDAFKFMDEVIGGGLASFHTAGSLMGGRRVWSLCRLPGRLGTDLDPVEKFLLLVTAHDGSKAVTVTLTPTRVVCWNTMSLAIGQFESGKSQGFRVRHHSNVFEKVTDAKRLVAEAEGTLAQFEERMKHFQATPFTEDHFKALCLMLYPPPPVAVESGKMSDVPTTRQHIWGDMLDLFKNGTGQNLAGAHDTAWGALNAVTEYVDHKRRTVTPTAKHILAGFPDADMVQKSMLEDLIENGRRENRVESVMWGSGAKLKEQTLEILEGYAADGKLVTPANGGNGGNGGSDADSVVARLGDLVDFSG